MNHQDMQIAAMESYAEWLSGRESFEEDPEDRHDHSADYESHLGELLRLANCEYVVVDVETTGLDPNVDRVVEVAALRFSRREVVESFEQLVDPGKPIPAIASGIHFITDDDVRGKPTLEQIEAALDEFVGDSVVVAHNAGFDRSFLPMLADREWICTMRFAKHLWTEAPAYKNQVLRYWLGLDAHALDGIAAHRAAGDAFITGILFGRELDQLQEVGFVHEQLSDVARFVEAPIDVVRFDYGRKFRGALIADIPLDYLRWVADDAGARSEVQRLKVDPDTMAAVHRNLEGRLM